MLTLDEMTRFCRLYFHNYSVDHDISLNGNTSYWSVQLSAQPSVAGQMALLRKVFRGDDYLADETKGEVVVRFPVYTIGKYLRLDEVLSKLSAYYQGLAGTTIQLQVLLAPKDDEYLDAFSRAQKWEWLISSVSIGELFLSGEITESGPVFHHVFHSCHQADLNRDITNEIPHLINHWNMMLHEIMTQANSDMGPHDYMDIDMKSMAPAPYSVAFEDPHDLQMAANMCHSLELTEKYHIKIQKQSLETTLNCVALTDILFAINISQIYNLFGSDRQQ